MRKVTVYHYDAFSSVPNKGNPAGVVIDESLEDKDMQEIARKVGFNETAFIFESNKADMKIRYFTPGHEMNLCGHCTIASLFSLKSRGMLGNTDSLTIETKVGIIPVRFLESGNKLRVIMGQASPQFLQYQGPIDKVAGVLGLKAEDFDLSLPIVYGSTGTWTLLVPVKKLQAFRDMVPQTDLFPSVLKEIPKASIHPFCLETVKSYTHMHSRHFSSPYSGTIEDPVTGTASGVMGAYYATFIDKEDEELELIMEQGYEIKRDGEVFVHIKKDENGIQVDISGTAVYVKEYEIKFCI